jgi:hypothetical protein
MAGLHQQPRGLSGQNRPIFCILINTGQSCIDQYVGSRTCQTVPSPPGQWLASVTRTQVALPPFMNGAARAATVQGKRPTRSASDGEGTAPAQRSPRHTIWGYARRTHSPSPAGGDSFAYARMAFRPEPPSAPLKIRLHWWPVGQRPAEPCCLQEFGKLKVANAPLLF